MTMMWKRWLSLSFKEAGIRMDVKDMKRQLRLGRLSPEEGFSCLAASCPPSCPTSSGTLYINKITGFFLCSCGKKRGQWSTLEKTILEKKNLDAVEEPSPASQFAQRWKQLCSNTQLISDMPQHDLETALRNHDLPMFPDAAKLLSDGRVSSEGLVWPLCQQGGDVVGARLLTTSREYTEGGPGLVVLSRGSGEGSAIMVPTLGDAIALASVKVSGSVVCGPSEFRSLSQELLPQLENFSRITLWGGSNHIDQARAMALKLQDARCYLVRWSDSLSPLEAHRQGLDLKNILSSARPVWHKAITTFSSLREDVLSDLYNIEKVQGVKWKRFPSLNRLIRGHRRGELTVLTGPTGCGKTTFCSEYSLDLALQGVNTLWGSFEIRNSRLARTMLQQLAGVPLEENLELFNKFADDFEKLPVYFLMFHGQQTIKDVMEAVEHAFYIHDIGHVVVDNVQFMLGLGEETSHRQDRFWRQDAVIAAFRTFATQRNCHVTLVMHPRKERDMDELSTSSIFGSAKASQEADNVLIIQDKRLTAVRGKKYLQVAKNRYSGDLGIVPLDFNKSGLSYAQKKKDGATTVSNKTKQNDS